MKKTLLFSFWATLLLMMTQGAFGQPVVTWISPVNGATFQPGVTISLRARATNAVSFVEFFAASTNQMMNLGRGMLTSNNVYQLLWSNAPAGTFQMHAEAENNSGGRGVSGSVQITVAGGTTQLPPTITWTGADPSGYWSASANWSPAGVPVNGADLVFPGGLPPGDKVSTNDLTDSIFRSIRFDQAGGHTIRGNPITLTNRTDGIINSGTNVIACDLTFSGTPSTPQASTIGGSGELTVIGNVGGGSLYVSLYPRLVIRGQFTGGSVFVDWSRTLALYGDNPNAVSAEVHSSTLLVQGSQPNLNIRMFPNMEDLRGGSLSGDGLVGDVTGSGDITPDSTLSVKNVSASWLHIHLNGTNVGEYGRLVASGNVSFYGGRLFPSAGFNPQEGQIYTIVEKTSPGLANAFLGPEGTVTYLNGMPFRISYVGGDGNDVTLTVAAPTAPTITSQPQNVAVEAGSPATFSVAAEGTPPLAYQWRSGDSPIAGATGASFTIISAQASDAGDYSVVVSNSWGIAISSAATLAVLPGPLATHNLAADYSTNSNPSGVWSYGYKTTTTGELAIFPRFVRVSGAGDIWQKSSGGYPYITKNNFPTTIISDGGAGNYPPGTVWFYPGLDGEVDNFGAVRFTVPNGSDGEYEIVANVRSYLDGPISGDTDFHVIHSGSEVFGQFLPGSSSASYSNRLSLAAGETIDFLVGRGADGHLYASGLKITATIKWRNATAQPTNAVPVVTWLQPTNGATLPAGSTIVLRARATDSDGTVSFVDFFANSNLLGRVFPTSTNVYNFPWSNAPAGTFRLHAEAVDNAGNRGISGSVQITVVDTTAPVVTWLQPADGSTFPGGSPTILLSARATDSDGTVSFVEFFANNSRLAKVFTGSSNVYSFVWTSASAGVHQLHAEAVDNAGARSISVSVQIVVTTAPPVVTWVQPINNATFPTGNPILLSARATDSDGRVSFVDFFADSSLLGRVFICNAAITTGCGSNNNYNFVWSNAPAGTFRLHAEAVDNVVARSISDSVQITVSGTNLPTEVIMACPRGYTTIGNNFRDPLPASSVIANPQDGMQLFHWNSAVQAYDDVYQYIDGFGWFSASDPNEPIFRNGEGWWFHTEVQTQARFSGVPGTIQAKPRPANGFYFLSGQTPRLSRFQEVTGFAPQAGDRVYKYDVTVPTLPANPATSPSSTHVYNGSSWNVEPILDPGKAMWVELGGTNIPPVVTWVQPSNGAAFPPGASISLRARATDSDGTVSFVDFFASPSNGPPINVGRGTLGSSDGLYIRGWTNPPPGQYRLHAEAVDSAGGRGISDSVQIVVSGTNQPVVTWLQPSNGASFQVGNPIVLQARATDSDGIVSFVDFFAAPTNGPPIFVRRSTFGGTNNTYTVTWSRSNAPPAQFQLHAEAVDNTGARGISGSVQITFVDTNQPPANTPPVVTWLSPPDGSTFPAGSPILLSARATDSDGTVSFVEFFAGSSMLGRVFRGSPTNIIYNIAWSNAPAGQFQLHAEAVDNAGGRGISGSVQIVIGGTNPPPDPSRTEWDVSQDFSLTANPGDPWSYGYMNVLGGAFSLLTYSQYSPDNNGLMVFSWSKNGYEPVAVYKNQTSQTAISDGGYGTYPPGTVWFYGGVEGNVDNYGVIRFTVPTDKAGTYRVETAVRTYLDGPLSHDADFWVLRNGTQVFSRFLGPNSGTAYTNIFTLAAGDTIDFVCGRGQDNMIYGSGLKIQASLKRTDGPPPPPPPAHFDVARDFSTVSNPHGVWTYGWLTTLDGSLGLLTYQYNFAADNGVPLASWLLNPTQLPIVGKVVGTSTAHSDGDHFTGPPGTTWFSPGGDNTPQNYGAIRFTVPPGGDGHYRIETAVLPLFDGTRSRDADFHVLKNGEELFSEFLAPNTGTSYSNTVELTAGGTIDFVVGKGADGLTSDSALKIQATLNRLEGPPPPATNTPPVVTWLSPYNGDIFVPGAMIALGARAVDTNGAVSFVEFFAASTNQMMNLGRGVLASNNVYVVRWSNAPAGTFQLHAEAVDNLGARGVSGSVQIRVGGGTNQPPANTPPVVTWLSPPDGSTFPAGSPILLRARATDSDGTVSFVEFFAGSSMLGRVFRGSPTNTIYNMAWSNAPAGQFQLHAEAVDNGGGRGISGSVQIVIGGTNPPPPTADFDVSQDFSLTANPGGPWSYGYMNVLGGAFSLLTYSQYSPDNNGLMVFSWSKNGYEPVAVYKNQTSQTAISDGGYGTYPPGTVWFYGGVEGNVDNYGVIRFTVPADKAGTYRVETAVRTYLDGPLSHDADFWVLKNRMEVFSRFLGPNSGTAYTNIFTLAAGDTIDFVCGRGQDNMIYGSGLKIRATLTTTDQPPPTNTPPVVTWLSPPDGSTFPAGSPILLRARATDSDGTVSFVDFFANTSRLAQVFTASSNVYSFVWSNAPVGTHQLHAEAVDNAGGRGISDSVQITVGGGTNQPPTFSDANWSALGSGLDYPGWSPTVEALAVSGSSLYAGGFFITAGGSPAYKIAKWNGTNWSALGSGLTAPFDLEGKVAVVNALAVSGGGDLYAGGWFKTAGGIPATHVAKWNGSSWSPLGSGLGTGYQDVNALAVSGGDLYAGGWFTTAGGTPANRIAKWNGSSWSALGSGMNLSVNALAVSGSNLYAGGEFTTAGGTPANRIAKWDGNSWSPLGSGLGVGVSALAVSGGDLYAGGSFTTAGGTTVNYIARWNGSSWSPLGSGMNGPVSALAVSGSDLYAGGSFTTAGGSPANYIAKWNGTNWSALGSGMNNGVLALAVSGNHLYAGGGFTTAGGSPANRIAKARIGSCAESITVSGSSATIQFSGVVGCQYHVQRTDSPTSPMTWTTLTASPLSPADDGSFSFIDTNAPPGPAYYRLLQH